MFSTCATGNSRFLWVGFISAVADESVLICFSNRSRPKPLILDRCRNTAMDKEGDEIYLHGQKQTHRRIYWHTKTWIHGYGCSLSLCAAAAKKCVYTSDITIHSLSNILWIAQASVSQSQENTTLSLGRRAQTYMFFINLDPSFQNKLICKCMCCASFSSKITLISLLQPTLLQGGLWKCKKTCSVPLCLAEALK